MPVTVLKSPHQLGLSEFLSYDRRIFLAGGISNCPDWQEEFIKEFVSAYGLVYNVLLINPRRYGDLARTGDEAKTQIKWERHHLEHATHIIFWFPRESICPITLFELGQWATPQRIWNSTTLVGADSDYQRYFDIKTQLSLLGLNSISPTVSHLARMTAANMWSTKRI